MLVSLIPAWNLLPVSLKFIADVTDGRILSLVSLIPARNLLPVLPIPESNLSLMSLLQQGIHVGVSYTGKEFIASVSEIARNLLVVSLIQALKGQ